MSATGTTPAPASIRQCGVSFNKVEKRFGSLIALRAVSLDMLPGEFVALLGHNGAGKTTLLRISALLMIPTNGQISFTGTGSENDSDLESNKRLIGMVGLFTLAGVIGGYDPGEQVERTVTHLMAAVGLFGTLVLLANIIWGYNIYKTGQGN